MPAVLVDTNVLIYAHDSRELAKQARATRVLKGLRAANTYLSVQALSEFFSITTTGATPMLTVAEAAREVELFVQGWPVLPVTPAVVLEATRGVRILKLAYWDALFWATARLNQVSVIFSEDFSSGSVLEGVRFVNPFSEDFALEAWM